VAFEKKHTIRKFLQTPDSTETVKNSTVSQTILLQ